MAPHLLDHGGNCAGDCCEVQADAILVGWPLEAPFWRWVLPPWGVACLRVILGCVHEALVAGDGGFENICPPAMENAPVGPDPSWGCSFGEGLGHVGGLLYGVAGEGGLLQSFVQGGTYVCPPVDLPLTGFFRVCPCGLVYDVHVPGARPWYRS